MKILKIFGAVMALHLFAFILIFANPGCSSTKKKVAATEPAAAEAPTAVSVPNISPVPVEDLSGGYSASPGISFDPNAPATSAPAASTPRYSPTRPNSTAATAVQMQPVPDVTPTTTYTVTRNDSLWSVAKKHRISVAELAHANNLRSDAMLQLGQKLIIPAASSGASATSKIATGSSSSMSASEMAAPTPARAVKTSTTHVVKPGETLGGIARRYRVSQGDVALANNITNPALIRPGMALVIPGAQAAQAPKSESPTPSSPAASPARSAPSDELFNAPAPTPTIDVNAPPPADANVPVIRVEEQAPSSVR